MSEKTEWVNSDQPCSKCGLFTIRYRYIEDDECHEDVEFVCTNKRCNHHWWFEGSDY